jgi:hypothetical protein
MNVENTKKVLDAIEKERGARLRMDHWGRTPKGAGIISLEKVDCGTSMCLAGWANYIAHEEGKRQGGARISKPRSLDDTNHASKWLGMEDQFESLDGCEHDYEYSPFSGGHDNDMALDALRGCVRDRSWVNFLDYVNGEKDV